MKATAQRSLRAHADWLARAIRPGQHPGAPLSTRRVAALAVGVPPYLLLQATHWLGFALDELLFAEYRDVDIEQPVFILGLPRSGTTFLHRTLARDQSQWSTFSLWQAVLAPSIAQRRLIDALSRADQRLGGLASRALSYLTQSLAGSLDDIHEIGLDAAEEDYLTLLPAAGCFLAVLAFPYSESVWGLTRPGGMPDAERDELLTFYRRMLQKHLYQDPRRLLSKNAAFGAWAQPLAKLFPDARFVLCIRDPDAGLSSQLSAIREGQALFGVDPDERLIQQRFARMYREQYQHLLEHMQRYGARSSVVDMDALRLDGPAEIARLARELALPLDAELLIQLEAQSAATSATSSPHQHAKKLRADAETHRAYQALKAATYPSQNKAS